MMGSGVGLGFEFWVLVFRKGFEFWVLVSDTVVGESVLGGAGLSESV